MESEIKYDMYGNELLHLYCDEIQEVWKQVCDTLKTENPSLHKKFRQHVDNCENCKAHNLDVRLKLLT